MTARKNHSISIRGVSYHRLKALADKKQISIARLVERMLFRAELEADREPSRLRESRFKIMGQMGQIGRAVNEVMRYSDTGGRNLRVYTFPIAEYNPSSFSSPYIRTKPAKILRGRNVRR